MTSFKPESALFAPSDPKAFRIRLETRDRLEVPFYLGLAFFDEHQRRILFLDSHHSNETLIPGYPVEVRVVLETPWLCPGEYRIDACLYNPESIDEWQDACRFTVSNEIPYQGAIFEWAIKNTIVLPKFSISKQIVADSV